MTDERRLIHGGGDELGAELLQSALSDAPSDEARQRVLVSLGAAGAALTAAVTAKAAASSAAAKALTGTAGAGAAGATAAGAGGAASAGTALGAVSVFKWLGMGLLAGGVVTTGAVGVEHLVNPPGPAPSVVAAAAPETKRERPAPRQNVSPPVPPSPPLARDDAPARAPVAGFSASASAPKPDSTVSAEIGLIDRAREALERGDTNEALAALEEHDRTFESGALGEEAELLRIEALLARGRTDAAAVLARTFLQAHPNSPHADRARRALKRAEQAGVASFPKPEEQR